MDITKLEQKSNELKQFMAKYKTQNMLGCLSFLMTCISNGKARQELSELTSPMRQLYYLAGLMLSVEPNGDSEINYTNEDWNHIVKLLKDIDLEHVKLFYPKDESEVNEEWKKKVNIAMPTFLSYFNLGPLNYEEQVIEEIENVYTPMDDILTEEYDLCTADFLLFYKNLDSWCTYNFVSLSNPQLTPPRANWRDYTDLDVGADFPPMIHDILENCQTLSTFRSDPGIKNRFKPTDLAVDGLALQKVNTILSLLSTERAHSDFLYYTGCNPIVDKPIVKLGNGLYQVFEEKQVLHAIQSLLDKICKQSSKSNSRLSKHKGIYLENKIVELFGKFFGEEAEIYKSYYIDGCEQDIIVLYKGQILVIEAKAYTNKEPFRNAERAFVRIKQDFDRSIGYAYTQCKRVEDKMKNGETFNLYDKAGNVIRTIVPNDYDGNDFYMIVNQEAFGQIQIDLSSFLTIADGYNYPWAVRFYDLEIFILTLIARKKKPSYFFDFLIMREYLHGHVVCSDEGEICGAYITGQLTEKHAESDKVITFTPSTAAVFDDQYRKGMGFKNEKHWKQKHDASTIFW